MPTFLLKAHATRTYHKVFEVEADSVGDAMFDLESKLLEDGIDEEGWEAEDHLSPTDGDTYDEVRPHHLPDAKRHPPVMGAGLATILGGIKPKA